MLAVDLNWHQRLLQKDNCSEQGLVQNVVQDSFTQVHREEVDSNFEVVFFWLS